MGKPGLGESHLAAPAAGGTGGAVSLAQLDFVGAGVSLFSANGAPSKLVNGKPPDTGDLYIRTDGGVGTTIYRCTAGGASPTWAAIL